MTRIDYMPWRRRHQLNGSWFWDTYRHGKHWYIRICGVEIFDLPEED